MHKKKSILHHFFRVFAGSDVLIQCMSTTAHLLLYQTLYWSNIAIQISDALLDQTFHSEARINTTAQRRLLYNVIFPITLYCNSRAISIVAGCYITLLDMTNVGLTTIQHVCSFIAASRATLILVYFIA